MSEQITATVAELRKVAEMYRHAGHEHGIEPLLDRAAEQLEALSGQYDELDLILDAQAQALPQLVAELHQARALVGVAQERWAVRMHLVKEGMTHYESMADRAAAERFIASPPAWHKPDYSTDLVVVTSTTAETEWRAA